MILRILCIVSVLLVLGGVLLAADTAAPKKAPARTPAGEVMDDPSDAESDELDALSTEVAGLDSLDLSDPDLETEYHGGTRRIHLERSVFRRATPVVYAGNGRRDAFRALVVDEKKEGEIQTDLLRTEGAVLTGVVWAEGEYLAMVKDKDGTSFFLREGDPVYSGRVTAVTQSQVVCDISEFGDYRQVTLKVQTIAKPKG